MISMIMQGSRAIFLSFIIIGHDCETESSNIKTTKSKNDYTECNTPSLTNDILTLGLLQTIKPSTRNARLKKEAECSLIVLIIYLIQPTLVSQKRAGD